MPKTKKKPVTPQPKKDELDELKSLDIIDPIVAADPILAEETPDELEVEDVEAEDEEDMDLLGGDNW